MTTPTPGGRYGRDHLGIFSMRSTAPRPLSRVPRGRTERARYIAGFLVTVMAVAAMVLSLVGGPVHAQDSTGSPTTPVATRSFSTPAVALGGQLEVTIDVDNYGPFGGVVETLPPGSSYVSSSLSPSSAEVEGQEVKFVLFGESSFTYIVTASDTLGTYTFSGILKDENNVEHPVGGASSISVGFVPPSVSISRTNPGAMSNVRINSPIPLTATFSEPVFGFTLDDIIVANGIADNFAALDSVTYTFDVTPSDIGEVTVDIAAGIAQDADGNGNEAASRFSLGITYDDDGDGTVSKAEAIAAIRDYFGGNITKAQAIAVIRLYFSAPRVGKPGAPEGLTAAGNGQTRIDLSWSAPPSDGGAAITGYRIEVSEDRSIWTDLVANTGNASTSYSHTGLTAETTRHYQVSAINSAGTGPASDIATGITDTGSGNQAPDLVVDAPTVSSSTPDAGGTFTLQVTVRNQGNDRSGITYLHYYRSTDSTITAADTQVGTDDVVFHLDAMESSDKWTDVTAPSTPGTYYYGACVDAVRDESDTDNNCSSGVVVAVGTPPAPDLVVGTPTVSDSSPEVGESFTIAATVENQGSASSGSTTLRYYRSADSTISSSDTAVGTDHVGGLNPSGTSPESISVTAPSTPGTYYYGACVDSVTGENDTGNNCSTAVTVTVGTAPDLVVGTPTVSDSSPEVGESFTIAATVENQGSASSGSTTLRYYRSTDSTITTGDSQIGTDSVFQLEASERGNQSISLTAPDSPGTYYYGACVDAVSGEANTANNCSSAVAVTVGGITAGDYDADNDGLIEVSNLTQLNAIRWDLDGDGESRESGYSQAFPGAVAGMGCPDEGCSGYELVSDLNFDTNGNGQADAGDAYWNDGSGWDPIDLRTTFDGGGHTITNIYINRSDQDEVGLFGDPFVSGVIIRNVGLVSVDVTGKSSVGGLVGDAHGINISDSYVTGSVSGVGAVGGLIGDSFRSTITNSYSTASVSGSGSEVGGLVGDSHTDALSNSHASGNVSGGDAIGGLVGDSFSGTIVASFATGNVNGDDYVGGLIGDSHSTKIASGYATGDVVATGDEIGGLIGDTFETTIIASYAAGDVTGNVSVGGLVGNLFQGSVTAGYATGLVSGNADSGGLIGLRSLDPTINVSYWDSQTSGQSNSDGGIRKTTAELQSSTEYTGIFSTWNVDVDGDGSADDPWDFGSSSQYPVLKYGDLSVAAQRDTEVAAAAGPDLVVGTPMVTDSSPTTEESFTLSATVSNQGSASSISTTLRYYRSTDSSISSSDTAVGTDSVSGLSASGTSDESIDQTAPSTAGTYYYGACVDSVTGESDTTNNCSTAVAVAVGTPPAPDLVVGTPSVDDSSPTTEESFTLSATVSNQGSASSISTTLRYYRSTDSSISSSDTAVGTDSVSGLSASGTSDESIDQTAPSTAGTYYYGACVDSVTGESDTTNNCSTAVAVAVGTPPAPDLVVGTPSVDDSSPTTEESFTLSATVSNQGSASSGSTTLRYYRSTDSSISSSDTPVGTDTVGGLSASGTSDESTSVTAPSTAGTYYYGACVDSVTGESDTTNNCSTAVAVAVGTPPAPDLVVGTPSVDDSSPTTEESFTLSATVSNQGSASSGSTTLRYYRSTDSSISSSDTPVGTDTVGGLSASGTSDESTSVTAPSTAGTYYYGACVDAVSGESDTTNNCSTAVPVTVRAAPAEREALVALYEATGGSNWYNNRNWLSNAPLGDWYGVDTDTDGRVTSLNLRRNGLTGEIPPELGDLTSLESVHLHDNDLSGCVPVALRGVAVRGARLPFCDALAGGIPAAPAWIKYEHIDVSFAPDHVNVWWAETPGAYWYQTGKLGEVDAPATATIDGKTCGFIFKFFCGGPPYKVRACNADGCSGWTHTLPLSPADVQYQRDGSTIVVSWSSVTNADHYKVYHHNSDSSSCRLDSSGNPSSCEELTGAVVGTSFTHTNPDENANYYWVVACNNAGCSEIDSANPATFVGGPPAPASPPNQRYVWQGSTTVVSWDAVSGADHYTVYYDDFFSSSCSLSFGGSPSFCDELATNIRGTSYTHTSPDEDDNYYWVVACNSGGCSDIDSANSARFIDTRTPDLVVDSPTVSDSSPDAGETFTLSATVRNQGSASSGSTTLRYYRSTDSSISSSDTAVGTDSVSGLSASGTSDQSIDQTAPSTAGTYYYGACVDSVTGESDTTNNCSTAVTVTVTAAAAPDLVVDTPSVDDSSPEVGESFTLSATVSNQGSASSGSTTLRYYRSTDSTISSSDTSAGTDPVSGLSASGTSDESIDQTAPSTVGTYYYGACVDSVTGESDTGNNCSSGVEVTVQAAPVGAPDLVVGTPSVDDSSPTTGETFTLSATVSNQGSASSGSTTLRYYRSTDSSISSSDTAVGTDSVSGLSASGTSDESIDQTAPSTAGTYYYGACVDSVTGESDTTNNCSSGVAVAVGTPPAPDLVVDAPTVSENAPATGTTFTLSATVRNRGDGRSDFTDLRYYRSSDSTITSGDTPVGTDPVSRLNASASGDESISLTAPSTSGTYYYGACVDAVSGESDTNNNCSDAVAVTVVSAIPDLAIETPTVSDSSPHTGESFTLSVTVINQGNVRSDFTELRFYRSNDSTISSSDTQLGRRNRPWLDPYESEAVSIILKAPSSEGTYYFGACVDAVSGETDTANNCSAAVTVIVVTPISDLVVEVPTFSNSSPPAGTSLTLTATVRNQGIEPSSSSTTLRYYRSDDSTITASDTPVGTDSVGTLDASGSSDESISLTAPTTPGTYYYSACVDTISGESDASNNCSLAVTLNVVAAIPDLVADTPTVSESRPELGDSFTLSVTVRNQGNVRSARTTLRYYRSTDSTITTADTSVGTDSVFRLDASASGDKSISLTAPSTLGTYYYGACVDAVSGESNIDNNCSDAVEVVVVVPSGPDLAVEMPTVSKDTLEPGESFTLSVTVRNQGNAASGSTTLRYYHDSPNNQVDTSALDSLAGAGSNTVSITLTARSTPGSDYYKVCVDTVPGETNTDNNCSDRVWITVPDSIEYELTKCAITPGPDFDITIHVSLTAIRAVESVTIKGYVLNFGESPVEIGRKTIRNMAAGETVNTTVTGSVSEYYFQCAIEVDWD